jgi:pimeloyl-ACP methyl ester carboxylesterase
LTYELDRNALGNVLPALKRPVLAVHGEHDEYGSNRHPEVIGQLSGGQARVEIIADTYYVPHRERPESITSMVCAFFTKILRGRPRHLCRGWIAGKPEASNALNT